MSRSTEARCPPHTGGTKLLFVLHFLLVIFFFLNKTLLETLCSQEEKNVLNVYESAESDGV